MRLVMVTQDFPPVPGGIQTYAAELALRFHASLEKFAVIAPGVQGATAWDEKVPYRVIRVGRSSDHVPFTAVNALAKLGSEGFDTVFHTQWQTVIATKSAATFGGPRNIFLAAHGRELLLEPMKRFGLAQRAFNQLRRWSIAQAKGLFPVSRYTAGLLGDLGADKARIVRVPNGTDPNRFHPMDVTDLKSRHGLRGRRILLSVGRLAPRKGFDTVLESLRKIISIHPDTLYVMVGDGPDRDRLIALIERYGLENHVYMTGKVDWDELPRWHNVADVFVTPSRSAPPSVEGFGIVFLESNACGKPVIGARTGGIPDAVIDGETGLLVEADAPNELAEAVISLFSNRELCENLGRQGRRRVEEIGTWDHVHDILTRSMRERC